MVNGRDKIEAYLNSGQEYCTCVFGTIIAHVFLFSKKEARIMLLVHLPHFV